MKVYHDFCAYKVKICTYEVKSFAYEIKICTDGVKSCAYEVKIRTYEVKISAYEVKSLARKSIHEYLPRKVRSWTHWAEGHDPKIFLIFRVIIVNNRKVCL